MTRQKQPLLRELGQAVLIVALLPLILPLALFAVASHLLYRALLYLLVWAMWLPKGKDILFVYSDSPIWHEYMATEILPRVQERAIVLNWSERKKWSRWSLGVALFHHFGGDGDFNPLVVLFQPLRSARLFRFWSAFKDWKRGYKEPVERLRQELFAILQAKPDIRSFATIRRAPFHVCAVVVVISPFHSVRSTSVISSVVSRGDGPAEESSAP